MINCKCHQTRRIRPIRVTVGRAVPGGISHVPRRRPARDIPAPLARPAHHGSADPPRTGGCSSGGDEATSAVITPQDIASAARAQVAEGGTVNWAIDAMPATLNAFQADADSATTRITGALLPTLFPLDAKGGLS